MCIANIKTHNELIEKFWKLVAKLQDLRDRLGYSETDARIVLVSGMQLAVAGYGMGLHALTFDRTVAQVDAALGTSPTLGFDEKFKYVNDAWRHGLVTEFMFKVDALFSRLLVALGDQPQRGFFANARNLFPRVALPDAQNKLEIVMIPASIRNSSHNNGIHLGPPSSRTIDGKRFDFVTGQPCLCAGWREILIALTACTSVVDEVLFTPSIRSIPDGIHEPFAAAYAAAAGAWEW